MCKASRELLQRMPCALLSPHSNLPAGAGEGWASPEPRLGAGSRPNKEPLWLPGAREDPVLAVTPGQGHSLGPPSCSLLPFSCPKRELCAGTEGCNKSLECSALCLLSLGWDCCSLCSVHIQGGNGASTSLFLPVQLFSPLIFFSISCPEL